MSDQLYAHFAQDGTTVDNMIRLDPVAQPDYPTAGLVQVDPALGVGIGWTYSAGTFTAPAAPAPTAYAVISGKAQQAIAANNTYLAIGSPTNAQVVAQVQRLTKEATAVIRLVLNQLDSTTDT